MGVDAGDYDGDGWQDLFVANIDRELFTRCYTPENRLWLPDDHLLFGFVEGDAPARM